MILAVSALVLSSCSDYLDTESPSQQTSQVIFENEGMARSAIMDIYGNLTGTYVYGQKMSVNWQGVSDIELASGYNSDPSKELTSDTGAANFYSDWYNHTVQWKDIFAMAERASTAVEGIRNSDAFKSGNKVMTRFLGEALTLRSLAYFELVRRWGDIPYKEGTSESDLSNVYAGKTDRDEIYAALVRDMQEAVDYLPWMGEEAEYTCERITKGFAKGLLARIALFAGGWSVRDGNQFTDDSNVEHYNGSASGMGELNGFYVGRAKNWRDYYEIAEQQCAEMIGDLQNPHPLDPDYGDIWKTVNHLDYNAYGENLFEVANGMGYNGDVGKLMGREQDGNIGFGSFGWGSSYVNSNGYYFYSFTPTDTRRDYACYFPKFGKENNQVHEIMRGDLLNVHFGKWCYFWTSDGYKALARTASGRPSTGINWILMRYSDVLLMFAEARYQLTGNADSKSGEAGMSAREALEKVRERAFGAGSAEIKKYDSDFFNAIVNERAWEFGCEGIRKLDLVRWGLLDQKIEEMKEALVKMYDGRLEVKIFDKTYQPTDFPEKLYYKYQSGDQSQFIDMQSCNFYRSLNANPDPAVYKELTWMRRENPNVDDIVNRSVRILVCGSGLRAKYDYSSLLSQLQFGSEIQAKLTQMTLGNGVCNYRHLFSIYYDDIYKSNGYLQNSYGYDHSLD